MTDCIAVVDVPGLLIWLDLTDDEHHSPAAGKVTLDPDEEETNG